MCKKYKVLSIMTQILKKYVDLDNLKLTPEQKTDARSILYAKLVKDESKLTKERINYIERIVDNIEPILKEKFRCSYDTLSPKQIDFLQSMAMLKTFKGDKWQKVFDKRTVEELQFRYEQTRKVEIERTVHEGTMVDTKTDECIVRSIELKEDGKTVYHATDIDGNEIKLTSDDIIGVYKEKTTMGSISRFKTVEELALESNVTKSVLSEIDELTERIEKLQIKFDEAKSVEELSKNDIKNLKAKYNYRLKKIEEHKAKIEELNGQIKIANEVQDNGKLANLIEKQNIEKGKLFELRQQIKNKKR